MSGLVDKITARVKKAAGDLVDDPGLREQGIRDERKATAKDELARAQREADERAEEVARLERETARTRTQRRGPSAGDGAAGSVAADHGGGENSSATTHT
jgi:uncharacterized protein YjbJ (UPF0337 family)